MSLLDKINSNRLPSLFITISIGLIVGCIYVLVNLEDVTKSAVKSSGLQDPTVIVIGIAFASVIGIILGLFILVLVHNEWV